MEASSGRREEGNSPESDSCSAEGKSLLEQRSSVYDHDEFDVFHKKEVDRSRVHIGKK